MEKKGPDFLIIGAQKTGTTALYSYLTKHSLIKAPKEKEIHFFSSDALYAKGLSYYLSFFPVCSDPYLTFEASPSYLMNQAAPQRIFDFNPNMLLIIILRDPVLRAYSAWNMYSKRYQEDREWYFDGWLANVKGNPDDFVRRKDDALHNFDLYITEEMAHYRKINTKKIEAPVLPQGFYVRYIERYIDLFSRDQILIIENEDLRNNTEQVLKQVQDFLRLPQQYWNKKDLQPVFEGDYTTKPTAIFKQLYEFYRPYNEQLYSLLGHRFKWEISFDHE